MQALLGIFPLKTPLTSTPHILIIFDNISTIPHTTFFNDLLNNNNTHIIVTLNSTTQPKELVKTIDRELLRGTRVIELKPLSSLHTTQRLVHAIMKGCDSDDFTPYNEEQKMLSLITEHTGGSPDIIDVTATLCAKHLSHGDTGIRRSFMKDFCKNVIKDEDSKRSSESSELKTQVEEEDHFTSAVIAAESAAASRPTDEEDIPLNPSTLVRFTTNLLQYLNLPQTDYFLLMSLQWFGSVPVPRELIEILQSLIMSASKDQMPSSKTPFDNLLSANLLRVYPATVVTKPSISSQSYAHPSSLPDTSASLSFICDSDFYYVPQVICDAVRYQMEPMDKDFSLTAALKALKHFSKEGCCDLTHAAGLANLLSTRPDELILCFQEIFRLYLSLVSTYRTRDQVSHVTGIN